MSDLPPLANGYPPVEPDDLDAPDTGDLDRELELWEREMERADVLAGFIDRALGV